MLLSIQNLAVNYGAIKALHDVSLDVDQGEIVTLIGSNGAGKTTLLRTISGLLKPASGTIQWQGASLNGRLAHEIVNLGHLPFAGRSPSLCESERAGQPSARRLSAARCETAGPGH